MSEAEATAIYTQVLDAITATQIGSGWTMNDQLDKLGKQILTGYKGSFPHDVAPKLKAGECSIVNQDVMGGKGIHWLALINVDGKLYGYDSFGRNMNKLINYRKPIVNDSKDQEQDLGGKLEENCGQRCLSWLYVAQNYGIENAMQI